jgi:hypothetical protein
MTDENEIEVMEVELTDIKGNIYVYWLKKKDLPYPDDTDSAIELALDFHVETIGTEIPEDDYSNEDDPILYRIAYDAFTRNENEYTWVTSK